MCSWCWAFRPVWLAVKAQLPTTLKVNYLLGGLAPDSQEPMPEPMQIFLQQTWLKIQTAVPGTRFNTDFWLHNTPRRSTYPACRAVIAASLQGKTFEEKMIEAIQQAYYLKAINPSDDHNLMSLAQQLKLDTKRFSHDLNAPETQANLLSQIHHHLQLGSQGFPSLIVEKSKNATTVPYSYTDSELTLKNILAQL
jgi:putative protein-disulfide isomerase